MKKSVLIGDSSEDVIYLLTVSDFAVGHTFLLFFCFFSKKLVEIFDILCCLEVFFFSTKENCGLRCIMLVFRERNLIIPDSLLLPKISISQYDY